MTCYDIMFSFVYACDLWRNDGTIMRSLWSHRSGGHFRLSMTSYGMFWNYGWNVLGLQTDGYITEPERSVGSLSFYTSLVRGIPVRLLSNTASWTVNDSSLRDSIHSIKLSYLMHTLGLSLWVLLSPGTLSLHFFHFLTLCWRANAYRFLRDWSPLQRNHRYVPNNQAS